MQGFFYFIRYVFECVCMYKILSYKNSGSFFIYILFFFFYNKNSGKYFETKLETFSFKLLNFMNCYNLKNFSYMHRLKYVTKKIKKNLCI